MLVYGGRLVRANGDPHPYWLDELNRLRSILLSVSLLSYPTNTALLEKEHGKKRPSSTLLQHTDPRVSSETLISMCSIISITEEG